MSTIPSDPHGTERCGERTVLDATAIAQNGWPPIGRVERIGFGCVTLLLLALLRPGTAPAATNLTFIDARNVRVRHFDGWGTSLCWWAHIVGGLTNRDEYADLAFKELGWNIVRYNIGGGENPARSNTMEFRARIPGFQPEPGKWDWTADANQRWMLRAAVARGANHVVAFANSPPYWMTHSESVTGAKRGSEDNLRPEFEATFADYLSTVVSNLTGLDGVKFDTVTPMNEPSANWWELGHRQEGTHMSVGQQMRMINLLSASLDRHGVRATIVASEDNDERNTYECVTAYDAVTLSTSRTSRRTPISPTLPPNCGNSPPAPANCSGFPNTAMANDPDCGWRDGFATTLSRSARRPGSTGSLPTAPAPGAWCGIVSMGAIQVFAGRGNFT